MPLVLKDRVKETSTTTGTGTLTLAGAATGFQSFSVIGNGNTTYYAIVDSAAGTWEVGIGTYTASGTTLSRDTVLESSNSGSLVNFAAGSKDVFCTYPAEKAVTLDDIQTLTNKTIDGSSNTITNVSLTTAVTGTLPIASGGTGGTTAQAARNSIAGAVTSGQYLRGNGTNVLMSAIQASDVPTLNQNTTGTAANVTGTVAAANGGTGRTSLTANNVILGNGTSAVNFVAPGTSGNVLTSNGTTWASAAPPSTAAQFTATGTGANTMPVGTTAQRPASPQAGMYRLNTTTTEPEWYDTVSSSWIPFRTEPTRSFSADFLVIAGGGGGGGSSSGSGGGGGAGGYREFTGQPLLPATSYTLTVGAGGSAGTSSGPGGQGSNSVFSTFTSSGGGYGGYNTAGNTGGSGGGSGNNGAGLTTFAGAAGNTPSTSPSQGNNGGANYPQLIAWTGGGGGGAGAVGGAGSSGNGGNGGNGTASSITGTSVTRAGGGGGGTWNTGTGGGTGGSGGGGNGGKGSGSAGAAGSTNTGGGGGGGGQDSAGGAGGSGVVIIKYPDAYTISNPGGGLTFSTASSGGFKVTTFTAGTGSIQFN